MAKTAVVNKKKKKNPKKRKRNYGAAAANPKKRRRRNPAPATPRRRSSSSPRRRNPGMFDFESIMDVVPSATGGVWLGRWAVKLAGKFEDSSRDGVPEPGLKHAIAILIAANMGGDMLGNMMGSAAKGDYARISCLGFGGDLFLRKRFMRDSPFITENLSLAGLGYHDGDGYQQQPAHLAGFQQTSALGANGQHLMLGPDGQYYQMPDAAMQAPPNYNQVRNDVGSFSQTSSLGMAKAISNQNSSFGY